MGTEGSDVAPLEVSKKILVLRGQRVLLDSDLAALYGVSTKALNQAVRRNADRFPSDFLLSLKNQDIASLRSQFVTFKERSWPPPSSTARERQP